MNSIEKYRDLCNTELSIPISARDWWLDIVAGPNAWNVVTVENGEEIVAAIPYVLQKKAGLAVIGMPRFTYSLGPWIKYPDGQKYSSRLSYEHKILNELINEIPAVPRFHQRFHHSFGNWLPFFWHGFSQTTRYSYILPNLANLDAVFAGFRSNIRREIRKAEKKLIVKAGGKSQELYRVIEKTYLRQNRRLSYDQEFFQQLCDAALSRNSGEILLAVDKDDKVHSGLLVVWDASSAYYIIGGSDPALRNSGAASLVMWHAIKLAAQRNLAFNFCGSMMEPIERFFRAFGAQQVPYFSVSRNNLFFRIIESFRKNK